MPRRLLASLTLLLLALSSGLGADETELLKALQAVGKEGAGSPAARAAWDRLVAQGPAVLPRLLDAMDTPNTVVANWLRTAFDRVAEPALRAGGKGIDADALLAFTRDPRRQGRARRLALDVVEQLRPGTRDRLIPGWLDDPEFRYEAIEVVVREADDLLKKGQKEQAIALYRKGFDASRDLAQGQLVAGRLRSVGAEASVIAHFGYLADWYAIGPFDAKGLKGFTTAYPPETKLDLAAELPGKEGPVRWKRHRVKETVAATHTRGALVNLLEPLGQAEDAVAYAYTAFTAPAAQEVEFRGAADDNFTVWVNGTRVFGFEEYRNGVRFDRHRFRVTLRPGVNTVLVKVCQAPVEPGNTEPNWEFLLRITDPTGRGLPFPSALPQ